MDFSSTTAKILGTLGASAVIATSAGVGIDQSNKHNTNKAFQEKISTIKTFAKNNKITELGSGLIEFLKDQDIIFDLYKDDEKTELTGTNFSSGNYYLIIKTKIKISENSKNLKTSKEGKIDINVLKALNKGKDWTWECNIRLETEPAKTITGLAEKNKFFNDQKDGFFDMLKETSNKPNSKEWKEKFIRKCSIDKQVKFYLEEKKEQPTSNLLYFSKKFDSYDNAQQWFEGITVIQNTTVSWTMS